MVSSKIALTTNGTWSRELSSSWSATVVFGCTIPPCREIRDQQIDCVIHNKEINLSLFIYKEDNQPGLRMHNMNQLTQSQLWCDGKPQHSKYQQVLLPFLCLGLGELVQHSHCMQSPKDKTIIMKIIFHVSFFCDSRFPKQRGVPLLVEFLLNLGGSCEYAAIPGQWCCLVLVAHVYWLYQCPILLKMICHHLKLSSVWIKLRY